MTSGKFYWESTLTAQTGSHAGIGGLSALTNGMNRAGHGETWMYTATNGNLYHQNSNSSYELHMLLVMLLDRRLMQIMAL